MFEIMYKVFKINQDLKGKYTASLIFGFFESLMANFTLAMIFVALWAIFTGYPIDTMFSVYIFAGLVFGIVLRALFKFAVNSRQQGTGFIIFAQERKKIGDRLKRYPMGYYAHDGVGTISSVLTGDMSQIEDTGVGAMGNYVAGVITTIVFVLIVTILDWRVGLIYIAFLLLAWLVLAMVRRSSITGAFDHLEAAKNMVASVIEYVKGLPVIKAFNLAESNQKKIFKDFKAYHNVQLGYEVHLIHLITVSWIVTSLGVSAIIFGSALFEMQGSLIAPIAVLLMIISFKLFDAIQLMSILTATISVSGDALARFEKVKEMPIIDADGKNISLDKFNIEFSDVRFSYDEDSREILRGINFSVPENTMTALVGKSGSGKSTIVNLIARFWDVSSGSISVGGRDIRELTIDSLYENIAMVFQKVYLFNDTIYNNLVYGKPDATMDDIITACKKARCHDFIMSLPDGYDSMVGEGGGKLSGGEKQRISIARAILKDAPIVLLDEATASIDPENESFIQEAISELIKNKTLIVIAHKLSSIKFAHQILVVGDGQIAEQGTHDELLALGGEYSKLWNLRMKSQSWEIS